MFSSARLVRIGGCSLLLALVFCLHLPAQLFVRGDVDASGHLAITDAVVLLGSLFRGQIDRVPCFDAADADDSGDVQLTDAVFVLNSLFRSGERPPYPFPHCGADPTEDELDCEEFSSCRPLVAFFDEVITGDGLYFLADRSGSVGGGLGWPRTVKPELARVLGELPDGTEFGVVIFDGRLVRFPATDGPAIADAETRAAAIDWVNGTGGGAGSCPEAAFLSVLDWIDHAAGRRQAIHYVGDGGGTCHGRTEADYVRDLIENVTERNAERAQIHTFGVGGSARRIEFLIELTRRNGGVHVQVWP